MTKVTQGPGACFLIHGPSKVGKTTLGAGCPGPVLILDAEGKTRFLRKKMITWDPMSEEPPKDDGTWEVCIVKVRAYHSIGKAYEWLNSGKHPFKSVVLDSISEIQQRCKDGIAGVASMNQQLWGELLTRVSSLVRSFRDLIEHPTNPLQAVVIIAMTREAGGRWVPFVEGQLQARLPYYIDVVAYYAPTTNDEQQPVRRLFITPHPLWDAGDTTGCLPDYIDSPTVPDMLKLIHEGGM